MPSRFPKVFQKRKSSSDVLEDTSSRPSFRVLERPAEVAKPADERPKTGLRRPKTDFRPLSEGNIDDNPDRFGIQNRGSGGTQRSGSSYGAYNTSSSDRFSSSSTLPSAASTEGDDFSGPPAHPRSSKTMPASGSSAAGFMRTAGRKFSFGGKKSFEAAEALRSNETSAPERPIYSGIHDLHMDHDLPAVPQIGRARATTETSYGSGTTVTPSKTLDKLDLNGASDDEGFGDIFAGIGEEKRKSQMLSASPNPRPLMESNDSYQPYRPETVTPAPLRATRPYDSPYAVESAKSTDGLMVASPVQERGGVFEMGVKSPTDTRNLHRSGPQSPTSPTSPSRQNRPRRQSKAGLKGLLPRQDSSYFEDTDALLVNESASRKNSPMTERAPPSFRDEPSLSSHAETAPANPWTEERKPPPPPQHRQVPTIAPPSPSPNADVDESLLNDASFAAMAISADRIQQRAPSPPRAKPAGKVMTPAQFERYRRDQAQRRLADNDLSDSDDSKSENEEEEEDDHERHKRLAKQRQRQEAQMSVFRQSMMKTTGEQPMSAASTLKPPMDRNSSRLSTKTSLTNLRVSVSPSEEEDEDDDVPLGILAAHGFPSKENNRPPNHERSGSAAGIQYSSETYPPPPVSTAGGPAGPLPAFARKLPQDPFYGASLVNQSDRQSFALGGGDRGSVYGGSVAGASQSASHLPPPGGLIGVIASEERARAIRRGSPAKTFGFGAQDANGSMPLPPGMGGQPMMPMPMPSPQLQPPTPSAESQANVQMAQQMTQMMQMQMQWMQQMMQMQSSGAQMNPQMQQMQQMQQMMMGMNQGGPAGMPGMQMPNQQQNGRASTMMGSPNMHPNLNLPNQNGRAMSMMGGARAPSMMMGGLVPQPGYTPSIAPSERSNIGQPSRYRPVSHMPLEPGSRSRTNSFSSKSQFGAFGNGRTSTMGARPSTSGGLLESGKGRVNVRVVQSRNDDDDEAGWEEMRKKKENKKGLWRLRKGGNAREKENVSPQPQHNNARSPKKSPEGLDGVFVPDIGSI